MKALQPNSDDLQPKSKTNLKIETSDGEECGQGPPSAQSAGSLEKRYKKTRRSGSL